MPDDKAKAITCVVLSGVGWLVFVGTFLYVKYVPWPDNGDFTPMINMLYISLSIIIAIVVHVANIILGTVFLFQDNEYKIACLSGLLVSIAYIVCGIIFYLVGFYLI